MQQDNYNSDQKQAVNLEEGEYRSDCSCIWCKRFFHEKAWTEEWNHTNKRTKWNNWSGEEGWYSHGWAGDDWQGKEWPEEDCWWCGASHDCPVCKGEMSWTDYACELVQKKYAEHESPKDQSTDDLGQGAAEEMAQQTVPSPEYDPFKEAPVVDDTCLDTEAFAADEHGLDPHPGQSTASSSTQEMPPSSNPLQWQKSGWMNRCVLLIALWKKGHFNKMQEYMWKFAEHHTIKMPVMLLESHLQKFGPEEGPYKLGYNF